MTVPSETSRVTFAGNGVTTAIATGFVFLDSGTVRVVLTSGGVDSVLVEGIDFTVTQPAGEGSRAGTVTMATPPAVGETLTIERDVTLTQDTSFRTQGAFSPSVHEDQMDRLTFEVQELKRDLADTVLGSSSANIAAGSGLTSTGAAPVTLHVGAGNGIIVNPDNIDVDFGVTGGMDGVSSDAAAASAGVEVQVARIDHAHVAFTAIAGTIAVGDTAAQGASQFLSRADHRHALPAPAAPADVTKAAASAGVATTVARADHKHDISTAAAVELTDAANAEGAATSLARSNHTHAHGNRGGGSLHAAAVSGGAAGFMTGADKALLDRLNALARVRAAANVAQTLIAGAGAVVLQFNDDSSVPAVFWDTLNNFNVANYRFTAPRTGFYEVSGTVRVNKSGGGNWTAGDQLSLTARINGALTYWEGGDAVAWAAQPVSMVVNFATTLKLTAGDYLEIMATQAGASNAAVAKGYLQINELP